MTSEEVLKLIDAGFSADEIRAMQTNKEDPKTVASTQKDESVAPTPEVKPEVKTEVPDNVKELGDAVKNLNDTVKALQDANIKNAVSESPLDSVNKNINDFLNTL